MRRSNAAVAIYLAVVFLSGALVGALGHRLYTSTSVSAKGGRPRSPEEYRRRYVDEMRTRLRLNEAQVKDLNVILDQTRDRFRALHEKGRPEMHAIQDEQVQRINAILDAGQKSEYEKMRAERDKRMKEKDKGRGGW